MTATPKTFLLLFIVFCLGNDTNAMYSCYSDSAYLKDHHDAAAAGIPCPHYVKIKTTITNGDYCDSRHMDDGLLKSWEDRPGCCKTCEKNVIKKCRENNYPADIHFLLDTSGYWDHSPVTNASEDFEKVKKFLKKFTSSFIIGSNRQIKFGVSTFGSEVTNQFWMDYRNKDALMSAIDGIPNTVQGYVKTDLGLKFVRQNAFARAHGGRSGVVNILIVITHASSKSGAWASMKREADLTRNNKDNDDNIRILALGLDFGTHDLAEIVDKPESYMKEDMAYLLNDSSLTALQKRTCEEMDIPERK